MMTLTTAAGTPIRIAAWSVVRIVDNGTAGCDVYQLSIGSGTSYATTGGHARLTVKESAEEVVRRRDQALGAFIDQLLGRWRAERAGEAAPGPRRDRAS